MGLGTLSDLVNLVRSPALRMRTGLWLMPLASLGNERAEAARLGLDAVDMRERLLAGLPDGARFARLSAATLEEVFDRAAAASGAFDAALAYNADLLLARLSYGERRQVWHFLHHSMPHRSRGLVVAMPETADELLPPPEDLAQWDSEGRLAR